MPAFNLTAKSARDLWRDHSDSYREQISEMVGLIPTAAIVDWLVGEMVQLAIREAPRAWAWFSRQAAGIRQRLEAAADKLDARLTWHRIANADLRELFEANDDLWDLFRGGLQVLLQLIESDVAEVEAAEGLKILGADGLAGFFRSAPLSSELKPRDRPRPQLPATRERVPVESMREAALLKRAQQAEAALAEAEALIASLEAESLPDEEEILDITPEPAAAESEVVIERLDEEEDEEPILGAAAMSLPGFDDEEPSPPASVHDAPEPRLKPAIPRRTAHPLDTAGAPRLQRRSRTQS